MSYQIELKTLQPQRTLSRTASTPLSAIPATMGELMGDVFGCIVGQGKQPPGPPFSRSHEIGDDKVTLECGLPVTDASACDGRVFSGELPGGEVISTFHVGPYELLPQAGAALDEWLKAHGRQAAGPNWEV